MNLKSYEVDIDSLEDCTRLLKLAQTLIGQHRAGKYGTHKERAGSVLDACQQIYNTDISPVYNSLMLDDAPVYYVYTHCEPTKNAHAGKNGKTTFAASIGMTKLPFYVGKGTGNRAYNLNRNETHRKVRQRLQQFGKEVIVEVLKDRLTEKEALMLESKLIDIFGLVANGGRLVNLDEGINSKERRVLYGDSLSKLTTLYKNSV